MTTSRRDEVLLEAKFDPRVMGYGRLAVSLFLIITLAGIPLIPIWLIWSSSYLPRAHGRLSAKLTASSLELTSGVYFRTDSTIPLDRITDVKLYDNPVMRPFGIQALKVETAGRSGTSSSEGYLPGVVDAAAFRDAVLRQRELLQDAGSASAAASTAAASEHDLLVEIRDLLRSIDSKASG